MPNGKKIKKHFYERPTLKVAQDLLGKILIRKYRDIKLRGKIVETEAYIGYKDKACHAARGKTYRNKVMFVGAGHAYVYLVYGMYNCLNIVTEKENYPAAVLIRAIEPISGIEKMKKYRKLKNINNYDIGNGPGKLCQALKIDRKLNGENLFGNKLWIADDGVKYANKYIIKTKRIGIDYAGESVNLPWRFYLKNNKYISQK